MPPFERPPTARAPCTCPPACLVAPSRAAAAGGRGLERGRRHHPRRVLMDVGLPDANGIELVARIKALLPDCAVIVISQHAVRTYAERARAAGAFAYVAKDAIYRKLLQAVAGALAAATEPRPE